MGWLSIIVCHLFILAFILALVESATTASRLLCFFFHPSTFFNTLLCLFYIYISLHLPITWKISAIWRFWSSLLIALALLTWMESQSSSLIQLRSCPLPLPCFSLYIYLCLSLCALHIICCTLQIHHPCITLEVLASVLEAEYFTRMKVHNHLASLET